MGAVFQQVFADMEKALISYLLKQAEIGVLGSGGGSGLLSLLGLGGGSNLGDISALNSAVKIIPDITVPHFADGGYVGGSGGPRSDNILAMLSPGEFVVSNDMQRQLSRGVPQAAGASVTAPVSVSIDARGADEAGLARVAAQLATLQRNLPGQIVSTTQDAFKRGAISSARG